MQAIDDPNIVNPIDSTIRNTKFKHIEALTNTSFPMTWNVKSDFLFSPPKNLPILIQSCKRRRLQSRSKSRNSKSYDFEKAAESSVEEKPRGDLTAICAATTLLLMPPSMPAPKIPILAAAPGQTAPPLLTPCGWPISWARLNDARWRERRWRCGRWRKLHTRLRARVFHLLGL